MMERICIIKLASLGDVLRTTPILHVLKKNECHITWITEKRAKPLVISSYVDRVVSFEEIEKSCDYDRLFNFDESEEACMLANTLNAQVKKGYGWRDDHFYPFDEDASYAFELTQNDNLKFKKNKKTYQEIVFGMAGVPYSHEEYILENIPRAEQIYDIGINHMVGHKFPCKVWPNWEAFYETYKDQAVISVQEMFPSLDEYIRWIARCKVLVTSDSLGMHIAIALKKYVIALFGSTSWAEIDLYERGAKITKELSCSPCYKKTCVYDSIKCMEAITAEEVWQAYISSSRGV